MICGYNCWAPSSTSPSSQEPSPFERCSLIHSSVLSIPYKHLPCLTCWKSHLWVPKWYVKELFPRTLDLSPYTLNSDLKTIELFVMDKRLCQEAGLFSLAFLSVLTWKWQAGSTYLTSLHTLGTAHGSQAWSCTCHCVMICLNPGTKSLCWCPRCMNLIFRTEHSPPCIAFCVCVCMCVCVKGRQKRGNFKV